MTTNETARPRRFMRRPKHVLLGVALALLSLTCAESMRADSKVYQDVLRSTGLVEVPDAAGSVTYGTCLVVDRQRGIALTARHVVGDAAEVIVYFPAYRDGAAITELDHYHRQVAAVCGRVVRRDVRRDLALLRLDALPDDVTPVHLAGHGAGPGDAVHSVGNSGAARGTLWRYTVGRVRSVYQARVLQGNGLLRARILETQSPFNPGDSGGPLVNDRGDLVGVVISTEKQTRLVSFNVDVSEVRAFLGEVLGSTKAQPTAGAPDADRQSPPVQGSWKVTVITLEGELLPGVCRFEADGTFTLTAQTAPEPQTRRGRYSYANGVLLMAWDRFKVREAPHWVKDRRFTFQSDEMLIFDRQPDAGATTESPVRKVSTSEHSPGTTEKTNGPRSPKGDQPPENGSGGPFPSTPVHPAQNPRTNWVLATMLIGAVSVFLLLAIKVRGHGNPTKSTAARTWEVEKHVSNEGVSDAANHGL
jgi:S1-C subfamily serine protease